MPKQAGQLLESLIALCEQGVQEVGVGVGVVALAAPSARFPSTGYDKQLNRRMYRNAHPTFNERSGQANDAHLPCSGNVYEVKLIQTCFTCYYDHRRWKCHVCTRGLISWKRVCQKEIVMQMLFKDNDSSLRRHLHFHRQLAISIAWSTRSSGISS